MKLKWVSNVWLDSPARRMFDQSQQEADRQRAEWLRDKVLGDPSDAAKHIPGAKGVYKWVEETEGDGGVDANDK